jgi:hypothetical protein
MRSADGPPPIPESVSFLFEIEKSQIKRQLLKALGRTPPLFMYSKVAEQTYLQTDVIRTGKPKFAQKRLWIAE